MLLLPLTLMVSGCTYKNVTVSAGDCFLRAEGTEVDIELSDLLPAITPLQAQTLAENNVPPQVLIEYRGEQCTVRLVR